MRILAFLPPLSKIFNFAHNFDFPKNRNSAVSENSCKGIFLREKFSGTAENFSLGANFSTPGNFGKIPGRG